jgi:hypothetical protein
MEKLFVDERRLHPKCRARRLAVEPDSPASDEPDHGRVVAEQHACVPRVGLVLGFALALRPIRLAPDELEERPLGRRRHEPRRAAGKTR